MLLVWLGALHRLGPGWALFLDFLGLRFSLEVFVVFPLQLNLFSFVSKKREKSRVLWWWWKLKPRSMRIFVHHVHPWIFYDKCLS